jgi:D-alanine transaminase/branched-chain amino acid aminotransferase
MNNNISYINEKFVTIEQAVIPINDLGIQRGYGVFDFLRVAGDKPLFIDDHLDRFFYSAEVMRLKIKQERTELKSIIQELINTNKLNHSGIRIILTGGESVDGYIISEPRLSIIQQSLKPPPDKLPDTGIMLVSNEYQRQLPHVKTTDYLMAIWLQPWMKEKNADDILYHHNGYISECPRSNFFMITKKNILVTPKEKILNGITRKKVIDLAKKIGIETEERDIHLNEITEIKEAFITSSTKRMLPVSKIDDYKLDALYTSGIMQTIWQQLVELEMNNQ